MDLPERVDDCQFLHELVVRQRRLAGLVRAKGIAGTIDPRLRDGRLTRSSCLLRRTRSGAALERLSESLDRGALRSHRPAARGGAGQRRAGSSHASRPAAAEIAFNID